MMTRIAASMRFRTSTVTAVMAASSERPGVSMMSTFCLQNGTGYSTMASLTVAAMASACGVSLVT